MYGNAKGQKLMTQTWIIAYKLMNKGLVHTLEKNILNLDLTLWWQVPLQSVTIKQKYIVLCGKLLKVKGYILFIFVPL